jgi:hypothetical protein
MFGIAETALVTAAACVRGNRDRKGDAAFFADLDPPQTFALRVDEILGNERQMVWRSGRALQA